MNALPDQRAREALFTPPGMLSVLRAMPEFREKEIALITSALENIESKKKLASEIAAHIRSSMPDVVAKGDKTLEDRVLAQLDELQKLLGMEKEEMVVKAERMAAIEKDPEKKSLLTRATNTMKEGWETVKNHKWKVIIALAAIAGGIAAWYYWDYLALFFKNLGFGGGEAVAGETAGATQAEAVGAAVEQSLTNTAAHTADFAVVEHEIFHKGIAYNVQSPKDLKSLGEVLKNLATDPELQLRRLRSETSRASAESAFEQLIKENVPGADVLRPSTFLEDLQGLPLDLFPQ